MPLYDNLSAQIEEARIYYVRYCRRPFIEGNWASWRGLSRRSYEAAACLREQNPVVAAQLLPPNGVAVNGFPGLPLLPSGIRFAVDDADERPNSIKLTVDAGGVVSMTVQPPNSTTTFLPIVTLTPTRASTVFDAPADGLYIVRLTVGTTTLTTVMVPVYRAEALKFRERSRLLGFQLHAANPRSNEAYDEHLALLYGLNAAGYTSQPVLFARLQAALAVLSAIPYPVAVRAYS